MKRILIPIFLALAIAIGTALSLKPVVLLLTKKQLTKIFNSSTVSIKDCDLAPFHQLSLCDIEIRGPQNYVFKARQITITYSPISIIKRSILKFSVQDARVAIDLPEKSLPDFMPYLNRGSSGLFSLQTLELVNFNLNWKSKDIRLEAEISAELSLIKQSVSSLNLKIVSLEGQNFLVEEGSLHIDQQLPGNLFVHKLQYDKLKIADIAAKARIEGKDFVLDSLSGQVLDGKFAGELTLKFGPSPAYLANLKFINLDLARFIADYNLKEKFQMSGKLGGEISFKGQGLMINILNGNFSAVAPGGMLIIQDASFLENIAKSSQQPLDIVVESFKNYHYNMGVVKLFLDKGNLILDMALDGETGKRNINITLHEFSLTKDGL